MADETLTSIAAWNEYMLNFLDELGETFPECPELFAAKSAAELLMEQDEMAVLTRFVEEVDPHSEALSNMNEKFFLNSEISFVKQLNIAQYWTADLEQETKQAVWQYLQTLLVMGKTIQSVPPQLLKMLEGYASKMTAQMGDNVDPSQMDMHALGMGALQHMQQQEPATFNDIFKGEAASLFTGQPTQTPSSTPTQTPSPTATQKPVAVQTKAPIGFDQLGQMLQGGDPFKVPGLGDQFAEHQQRVAIQRNGPIPPPPGWEHGKRIRK